MLEGKHKKSGENEEEEDDDSPPTASQVQLTRIEKILQMQGKQFNGNKRCVGVTIFIVQLSIIKLT